MPDRRQHLQRARDNGRLAHCLDTQLGYCVDWAITMLFYSALHYVDAYLAGKGTHPSDHRSRDNEVAHIGTLSGIYRDYRRLKDLSREARYQIPDFSLQNLERAQRRLESVRIHVEKLLTA